MPKIPWAFFYGKATSFCYIWTISLNPQGVLCLVDFSTTKKLEEHYEIT